MRHESWLTNDRLKPPPKAVIRDRITDAKTVAALLWVERWLNPPP